MLQSQSQQVSGNTSRVSLYQPVGNLQEVWTARKEPCKYLVFAAPGAPEHHNAVYRVVQTSTSHGYHDNTSYSSTYMRTVVEYYSYMQPRRGSLTMLLLNHVQEFFFRGCLHCIIERRRHHYEKLYEPRIANIGGLIHAILTVAAISARQIL